MKFAFVFDEVYLVKDQCLHEELVVSMFLQTIDGLLQKVIEFL